MRRTQLFSSYVSMGVAFVCSICFAVLVLVSDRVSLIVVSFLQSIAAVDFIFIGLSGSLLIGVLFYYMADKLYPI